MDVPVYVLLLLLNDSLTTRKSQVRFLTPASRAEEDKGKQEEEGRGPGLDKLCACLGQFLMLAGGRRVEGVQGGGYLSFMHGAPNRLCFLWIRVCI
ncbi:unnamed protein product [Calypogeia fissa]